jgi:regulator of sirC expression with transglutaminase-like and TPR domain
MKLGAETDNSIQRFAQLMEHEDAEINLAEAALAIAATEYAGLDASAWLARLDECAKDVQAEPGREAQANIRAMNEVLFEREHFSGNEEEYDDPRNSYLNDVLARKKGIPITLSVIYLEVGWRKGLPLVGVGFPGHFLVKYIAPGAEIFLDPYRSGATLTRQECESTLRTNFGQEAQLKSEYLAGVTQKQVLARMLNNLKGSYFRRRHYNKVLTMIELALAIDGGTPEDLRDRGMVLITMRRYREAMTDLEAYLALVPPDDPQVRETRRAIHHVRSLLN